MTSAKKLGKALGIRILAIVVGGYVFVYCAIPLILHENRIEIYFRPHFHRGFDADTWRKGGLVFDKNLGKQNFRYGERYPMVDDLLESRRLDGMGANDLFPLLGYPDAGIVSKTSLTSLSKQSGLDPLIAAANKDILNGRDNDANWFYHLSQQSDFPARSVFFPGWCFNFDRWKLELQIRNGRVVKTTITK